jgi:hypothetical protein
MTAPTRTARPARPATVTLPCMGCGRPTKCLPDRAACKGCREAAWRWWAALHAGMHPDLYQRAFNVAFGTAEGLRESVMAARAEVGG